MTARAGAPRRPPHTVPTARSWVAVLGSDAAAAASRSELKYVSAGQAASGTAIPAPGDRVIVLALPRVLLVGAATAARVRAGARPLLHLRDRIRAPRGHEVDPFSLRPHPVCTLAWTRGGLEEITGSFIEIDARDAERLEEAIRAQALAFGPGPGRPAHARPRTPARRAMGEGRAASGTLAARGRP